MNNVEIGLLFLGAGVLIILDALFGKFISLYTKWQGVLVGIACIIGAIANFCHK